MPSPAGCHTALREWPCDRSEIEMTKSDGSGRQQASGDSAAWEPGMCRNCGHESGSVIYPAEMCPACGDERGNV